MAARKRLFRLPWRSARQIREDVDEELRFHLETRVDALVKLGAAPAHARAQALREFGDVEDARRYMGRVDRGTEAAARRNDLVQELGQDLRYAARTLRAAPVFAATVVLTLALGIGANTAIFSVVHSVLLRALPFARPDQLVRINFSMDGQADAGSPPELADLRAQSRTLAAVAMYDGAAANLVRRDGEAEQLVAVHVSANWFDLLRVAPLVGRTFAEGEDREGAPKVVLLSERVWRRDFGADSSIVGRGVRLDGEVRTVIGVVPAARGYPFTADLWEPFVATAAQTRDEARGARWVSMLGRLRDGATVDAARAELNAIARHVESSFPRTYNHFDMHPVPMQEAIVGELRRPLLVIMAAVALVLLVACANVANLTLVRATARESELAIRSALGAGRSRLARQMVTEALVLCSIGAAAGVLLAYAGVRELLRMAPDSLPQLQRAHIDLPTLGVTAVIAALTGVLFGVLPVMRDSRANVAGALRAGARGTRGLPAANRVKHAIVVSEVALAVLLLAASGLLLRSFQRLMAIDPGFRPQGTLVFRVSLPPRTYPDDDRVRNFVGALGERLRAIPGVRRVGVSNALPLDGSDFTLSFTIRGRPPLPENAQPSAQIVVATPDFLPALGVPLLSGRAFTDADRPGAARVAIVSRGFAKQFFPGQNPIGQSVDLGWSVDGNRRGGTIVGVVGDVKQVALDRASPATLYLPFAQAPRPALRLVLQTDVPPASVAAAARRAIAETDRELPVFGLRTLEEHVATSVAAQRFYASLVTLFAAVALVLAAIGLYGIIAYAVSQRSHELGVRLALGAGAERITRMVVGEGLALAAAGAAIGIVSALAAGSLLTTLLFGVSPRDPITLGGVAALLLAVAVLASWVPARRAARVDPLLAMRGE
jgi:predicted permease